MSNILIVEDSVDLSQMYVQLFAMSRHDVTLITTGKNIDVVIENIKPDVILLDIYLGGEDGRDICREIKQTHKNIPVIMVSVSMELKEKSIACGADDYIEKPFEIMLFTSKVIRWAKRYQQVQFDLAI
ncbi:response regulator [Ferruginibacter paludis]|uniref:response regulator transcription factor n=1 Tax=Ferruginibacter paludis TaxID=1310417 RepID=UPI0025B38DAC|nr:response regulator [Ferruginibacter paludis]MDN3655374.1 response regulator [Ferruginibacter paludis]